jgi:hypothetical protein
MDYVARERRTLDHRRGRSAFEPAMSAVAHDLLLERFKPYREAHQRYQRAMEARLRAERRASPSSNMSSPPPRMKIGEHWVTHSLDGTKPPTRKTEKARTALKKARGELEALQYAAERAGQMLERRPIESKRD